MLPSWAGWTVAGLLVLALGWVADQPLVIAGGLLVSILCGSRWIAIARDRREVESKAESAAESAVAQNDATTRSNIIRFRRPD
jgi:hypothetical protein